LRGQALLVVIWNRVTQISVIFPKQKYMFGDEFSMLDVAIAPLLWRLDHYGIKLGNDNVPLTKYAERLFSRPAYIASITPAEKAMHKYAIQLPIAFDCILIRRIGRRTRVQHMASLYHLKLLSDYWGPL